MFRRYWPFLAGILIVLATSLPASAEERLIYAYKNNAAGNFAIYTKSLDTPDHGQELITISGDAWMPRVSPDGTKVAYTGKVSGAIYVADINGRNRRALGNRVPARSIAWSSDGTKIYYWGSSSASSAHAFYRVPASGGTGTVMFGGRTYWCWFYDGGFDVFQVRLASGRLQEYILFGASPTGTRGSKCNLLRLPVSDTAQPLTAIFNGLGDNYTPSRGSSNGRIIFQADNDRRGSHRIYRLNANGTTTSLSDLYAGSPRWNSTQARYVYVKASSSTYGARAYQGALWTRNADGTSHRAQTTIGVAACPSFYTVSTASRGAYSIRYNHRITFNQTGLTQTNTTTGSVPFNVAATGRISGSGNVTVTTTGTAGPCTVRGGGPCSVTLGGTRGTQMNVTLNEVWRLSLTYYCPDQAPRTVSLGTQTQPTRPLSFPIRNGATITQPFIGAGGSGTYSWTLYINGS